MSTVYLKDIAEIVMGHSPEGTDCNPVGVGIPLLNGPSEFGQISPTPVQWTTAPRRISREGDILFCVRGSTTGRMNFADQAYAIGRGLAAIRSKKGSDFNFLLRAILDHLLEDILSVTTGSTFPNISKPDLENLEIPWNSQVERAAQFFANISAKVSSNFRLSSTLEEMSQALFKSWFVDFDPVVAKSEGRKPFGMSDDIAALFPDSFEESELGAVPKGWRVGTLSQLCDSVETGGTPSRSQTNYWVGGTIPWVKTGELNDAFILTTEESITELGLKSSNCKLWGPGTVILALYGATVGKLGVLAKTATANQACAALIPSRRFGFPFILNQVLTVRPELCSLAIGAAQQNLNLSTVREFRIVVPEDSVSAAFDQIVRPFYQQIECLCAQNRLLEDCRSLLLPRLLSGEISEGSVASPEATAA